jgi:hypothetical protein
MKISWLGMIFAALASPASAYELGSVMRGAPEATIHSSRSFNEVKRCVVMADLSGPPSVYEDDKLTLIHGGRDLRVLFAYQIVKVQAGTDIVIWQGTGNKDKFKACL